MSAEKKLPLVYACSGASSAAQMANHLAVKLDRLKVAEMSCIAGVGGDVKPLVKVARSGRPIIALDGCPLHCVAKILARHGLKADQHVDLSELGVKKRPHEDFDALEAAQVLAQLAEAAKTLGVARAFSLSSSEGGEGRGEEADDLAGSKPLTPPLSPLGRGEGVKRR